MILFSLTLSSVAVLPSVFAWNEQITSNLDKVDNTENNEMVRYDYYPSKNNIVEGKSIYIDVAPKQENLLIEYDEEENLEEKAIDAGEAIVEAGEKTTEVIVEAGTEAVDKGIEIGEVIVEKGTETGEVIIEKGSEGIQELNEKINDDNNSSNDNDNGGGCLIATAAYGTELSPQVQQLRELRDNTVLNTKSGAAFMTAFNQFYYSFSPTIADWQRENPALKEATKIALTPLLTSLSILNHTGMDSESEILGYGIGVILLNIAMYGGIPVFGFLKLYQFARKRNNNNDNTNNSNNNC